MVLRQANLAVLALHGCYRRRPFRDPILFEKGKRNRYKTSSGMVIAIYYAILTKSLTWFSITPPYVTVHRSASKCSSCLAGHCFKFFFLNPKTGWNTIVLGLHNVFFFTSYFKSWRYEMSPFCSRLSTFYLNTDHYKSLLILCCPSSFCFRTRMQSLQYRIAP